MTCHFGVSTKKGTGGHDAINYHLDRTAENTGMTCAFTQSRKRVKAVDVPDSTTPAATPVLARVKLKP